MKSAIFSDMSYSSLEFTDVSEERTAQSFDLRYAKKATRNNQVACFLLSFSLIPKMATVRSSETSVNFKLHSIMSQNMALSKNEIDKKLKHNKQLLC
jgi:hypothetical protein